jgi:iron complex outermembrane receptor protein
MRVRGSTPALLVACAVLSAAPARAEQDGPRDSAGEAGDDVVVVASRVPTPLARTPAAISIVDVPQELTGRAAAGLGEALVFVPGVVARGATNFAQDLRLSIRGFGARAAFGIRGVTVLVDGFPETLPDGQAQVDSIDVESAERIEVVRGLASSLYGNAAGGVVRIESARPTAVPQIMLRGAAGADRFAKVAARASGHAGALGYAASLSTLRTDGWRDRSSAEQTVSNTILTAPISSGELLVALSLADAPVAQDPGGLTSAEVSADRRQASPVSLRFATGESLRHARLGAAWSGALTPRQTMELRVWGSHRSFRSNVPSSVVEFDRDAGGASAGWALRHALGAVRARLALGVEVQSQLDRRTNRPNEDGTAGPALTLAQDETVTAAGARVEEEVTVAEQLTLVAGARFDVSRYGAKDRLLADGDASGSRTFRQPTGRLGAIWARSPGLSLYASLSQAFEAPTTTELVDLAQGGFNPDLDPQRALGLELGARGRTGAASWDLAVFSTRIVDGLVRQEDALGRAFYVNAARSTHRGVEVSVGAPLFAALGARATYTLLDARFDRYAPRGEDLSDRRIPGIPRHSAAAELTWGRGGGPFAAVEVRSAGGWYVDDENATSEPLAWILNSRASWPFSVGRTHIAPFLAAENLASRHVSDAVRINATGGRYFEPAPPLRFSGGLAFALEVGQ